MSFRTFDLALDLVRKVRWPLEIVAKVDANLADQLKRAASSVPSHVSEGHRRVGRDRFNLWRYAAGSTAEVAAALRTAEAWGHVTPADIAPALGTCDHLLAILWKLTH